MKLYAHSKKGSSPDGWQLLDDHSANVASLTGSFASHFDSSSWGYMAGLLHDLGKSRNSFQTYLMYSNGINDVKYDNSDHSHSGAGAAWIVKQHGRPGRLLAYLIAGHHAGLPDWSNGIEPNGALSARLAPETGEIDVLNEAAVCRYITANETSWVNLLKECRPPWRFVEKDVSFWLRMLYSCLVDADFLDTENFISPEISTSRSSYPSLLELSNRFFSRLDEKQLNASPTPVNKIRAEIRLDCEKAANLSPGLFSLTVPTGGGKTLSGTAFAFQHALKHNLKRIIYVIPYTSIIEQTADILRHFLGEEAVVEHHSNFDPEKETQASRLASENWDAPVIVTTSVQFFESLYACKSSSCRKLHNLTESVIILDEVQLLPPELLLPCTEAIHQLTANYKSTVILSTATQPALPGLQSVREIITPERNLYNRLKRTTIEFPEDRTIRQTWQDIANKLMTHEKVLCVVNTRADCLELFNLLPEDETIHLSASMCGAHRANAIAEIKQRLKSPGALRVVSTQLVEAGVDIDFPVVYRAFSSLSSIVQTAGRCNREGLLENEYGRVIVFMPPKQSPQGLLRFGEYATEDILARPELTLDDASIFPEFFMSFYGRVHDHGKKFERLLTDGAREFQFQFREAAAKFQMIDNNFSAPVIVQYGDNDDLIKELQTSGASRMLMRKLQRYTVNVPRYRLTCLIQNGLVTTVGGEADGAGGIHIQADPALYSETTGLDMHREHITRTT